MQKVFLTGSTGYVGTKFVDVYGQDFEIFEVARGNSEHPLDLEDLPSIRQAFTEFQPDIIIHAAAHPCRDTNAKKDILITTPAIVANLISLALPNKTPFIFNSTEALYGGKDQTGEYLEIDEPAPRNPHGASKAACEKLLIDSSLPYLITRGHRYVGISKRFDRQKYFPDTLKALVAGQAVHLDSQKLFKPVLINNICDIFVHHIRHNLNAQLILNMGVDKKTTYYDFMTDVAKKLGLDTSLIHNDGDEQYWPADSSISVAKLGQLGYPQMSYDEVLQTIASDFKDL